MPKWVVIEMEVRLTTSSDRDSKDFQNEFRDIDLSFQNVPDEVNLDSLEIVEISFIEDWVQVHLQLSLTTQDITAGDLTRALKRLEFSFENLPESVSIKKVDIEEIEVVDEVEDEEDEEF